MTSMAEHLIDEYGKTLTIEETAIVLRKAPKTFYNRLSEKGADDFPFTIRNVMGTWRVNAISLGNFLDGVEEVDLPKPAKNKVGAPRKRIVAFLADLKACMDKLQSAEEFELLNKGQNSFKLGM